MGATLVSRDGACIVNTDKRILAPEAFAAMTATIMSAAETAFYHLGGGHDVRIIAETDGSRFVIVGTNEEMLLITITRPTVEAARLLPRIEEVTGQIRAILAEA